MYGRSERVGAETERRKKINNKTADIIKYRDESSTSI